MVNIFGNDYPILSLVTLAIAIIGACLSIKHEIQSNWRGVFVKCWPFYGEPYEALGKPKPKRPDAIFFHIVNKGQRIIKLEHIYLLLGDGTRVDVTMWADAKLPATLEHGDPLKLSIGLHQLEQSLFQASVDRNVTAPVKDIYIEDTLGNSDKAVLAPDVKNALPTLKG